LVRLMLVFVTTAFTMSSLIKRASRILWADAIGCAAGCQDATASTTLTFLCETLGFVLMNAAARFSNQTVFPGGVDVR
jgi:hypothetical protein